jgi:hypothetical protein
LPAFLRAGNLKDFISNDLVASTTPVEFVPLRGPGYQGRAFGYRALLPGVCWVYQDALVAQKLLPSQMHIGNACRFFLKALTPEPRIAAAKKNPARREPAGNETF